MTQTPHQAADPDAAPPGVEPAPAGPGAPLVKQTERPHPLTPFIRGWLVFVTFLLFFGRQLLPDGQSDDGFQTADLRWILPVVGAMVLLAALAGSVSWYFTRFVIDDEELRIETGALVKRSKKVPFERVQSVDLIQPMAARLFGLVELRIEAGAGDSSIKLRYLSRNKANQLRNYLLTRAQGQRSSLADAGHSLSPSALTDLGAADHPIVTVTAQRLVGSFLLSSEWLMTVLIGVVVLIVTASLHVTAYALPGLVPLLINAVSLVSRRVITMFHFTLAESPRGLRVTRGLTNLTSQSVPVNRIQGVRLSQPLFWKPFGWYRVDVDVLGYGGGDGENNSSTATSVLLPVAGESEVTMALSRVVPGVNLEIELQPSPRRARWLSWFDFWTLRYGWNDRVLVTQHGWLVRVRDLVPHAKTQSVRIEQGPLQRWLRLADVHIDTPKGPVNAVAHQLDEVAARSLALTQLDRARAARAAARERVAVAEVSEREDHTGEDEVLARYGIGPDQLVGSGGESRVFALDDRRVLRIYRSSPEASEQVAYQLRWLYDSWSGLDVGFEVPRILEIGQLGGRCYTVDRRMSGRSFSAWLSAAPVTERRLALTRYLDVALALPTLPSPVPGFARLVGQGAPQQFGSLAELLTYQMNQTLALSRDRLQHDVPAVAEVWDALQADLLQRDCQPRLVHGDLCPPNTYVSRAPDGSAVVTGIGDFSPHTLSADPLMDVAGAVCFLELETYDGSADDALWLSELSLSRLGADAARWLGVYRRFYGFYFSSTFDGEPEAYAWCLRQLTPPA